MSDVPTLVIWLNGAGQALFSARVLLQWYASERAKRSVVPPYFWHLSLTGSLCAAIYAGFKQDPVYMLASLPGVFIYARNLFLRHGAGLTTLLPLAAAMVAFILWATLSRQRFDLHFWSAVGLAGSVLWSSRWIVQWWISERRGHATLPASFFWVSLVASLLLIAYTVHDRDIWMFLAYGLNPVPNARNLLLMRRLKRAEAGG